jgi:hypothetical protein
MGSHSKTGGHQRPPDDNENDARPSTITTDTREQFEAVFERHRRGELYVHMMSVGKTNGQWILAVSYPQPKQAGLFDDHDELKGTGI